MCCPFPDYVVGILLSFCVALQPVPLDHWEQRLGFMGQFHVHALNFRRHNGYIIGEDVKPIAVPARLRTLNSDPRLHSCNQKYYGGC